jgi:hypothetical protein
MLTIVLERMLDRVLRLLHRHSAMANGQEQVRLAPSVPEASYARPSPEFVPVMLIAFGVCPDRLPMTVASSASLALFNAS